MDYDKIIYPIIILSKPLRKGNKRTAFQNRALGRGLRPKKEGKTRRLRKCIDV